MLTGSRARARTPRWGRIGEAAPEQRVPGRTRFQLSLELACQPAYPDLSPWCPHLPSIDQDQIGSKGARHSEEQQCCHSKSYHTKNLQPLACHPALARSPHSGCRQFRLFFNEIHSRQFAMRCLRSPKLLTELLTFFVPRRLDGFWPPIICAAFGTSRPHTSPIKTSRTHLLRQSTNEGYSSDCRSPMTQGFFVVGSGLLDQQL